MKTFQITIYDGIGRCKKKDVKGHEVTIEGFALFVDKRERDGILGDKYIRWSVNEVTSGFSLCSGDTKKEAIETARNIIINKGKQRVMDAINKALEKLKIELNP